MDHLDELENKSIYVIREAYKQYKNIALLWSIGKDSTALLWLCRKAFYGKIPFPAVHLDTSYKFKEIYEFREKYAKEWDLNLVVGRNEEAIKEGMCHDKGALACCNALKTNCLKKVIAEKKYRALLLAIRRDEHGIRSKERYFSPRDIDFQWNYKDQPPELWDQYKSKQSEEQHLRIHPMLHWTELDIWRYMQRENIPVTSLYFAKDGKRYRSIGCEPCCKPMDSEADTIDKIVEELQTTDVSERSGRAQDKENAYMMQKLRSLGYM
ncbi:MAG: sulfate adenylyltransferase [Candidatus Diapherotrites archaeon]|uniref:Sulfate adenylyltransferase subunit 2 n=1 Tax=Candidatus Iainarchaeum sp. TaxID=3101447 RepID=A0A2D6M047_9ARCH|nr:sulfate adenylyltransferase [Candidatus Diapherotrites archaeon]|tara:strand:+ start:4597 stop:5397 length:801 start_codon:yes stop_codon:yes gene_type:complete